MEVVCTMWNIDWPLTAAIVTVSVAATFCWRVLLLVSRRLFRVLRIVEVGQTRPAAFDRK
jgi:hypothetical protein